MRRPLLALVLAPAVFPFWACASAPPEDVDAHARRLAQETIILDGHVDLPYRLRSRPEDVSVRTERGDFDWPRARAGGLDAPFMSIYVPASAEDAGEARQVADELIDLVEGLCAEHPDKWAVATTADDVERLFAEGRIALLLGMENGGPIEGDLANLEHFRDRGIRYITLCHSKDNHICDSSYDERSSHGGLTAFGRELVPAMNAAGVMIDVSHISDDAFWQVMDLTRTPVIASHSSLRHFTPGFERNLSDDMVRRIAAGGGVVQINFGGTFVDDAYRTARSAQREEFQARLEAHELDRDSDDARALWTTLQDEDPVERPDVAVVADHIARVVELVGVDHVGFGSDFDGVGDTLPDGLRDVSMYPNLIAELLRHGFTDDEIRKVCSGNVLRVMRAVEGYAAAR